jgi:large subunit ribosomal protein L6
MSRVGKQPVKFDSSVKVQIQGDTIRVEGKGGKLAYQIPTGVKVDVVSGVVNVQKLPTLAKKQAGLWGTARTVIHNMVHGVTTGFTKELDIVGVGFRAAVKGNVLSLSLGYSHAIDYQIPTGITVEAKGTHLTVKGADRVLVGQVAAKIRGFREPEPYQGKGVKYTDERIVRKQGKAAGAK